MVEHSHELVTHLYHVKLPYHLLPTEVEFEPDAVARDVKALLGALVDDYKEDELRRIFVGAVVLLEKYPHRSLYEALDTAMTWERG